MFGRFFSKKAKQATVAISKVENRDLLEGIVAAAVLVGYADGEMEQKELEALEGIISSNDNLQHFGSEIGKLIGKYSTMYEKGKRLADIKLMKEITDLEVDEDQKIECFVIAIEIADADEDGIEEAELEVLNKIGKALGLNPANYI